MKILVGNLLLKILDIILRDDCLQRQVKTHRGTRPVLGNPLDDCVVKNRADRGLYA